MPGAAGAIRCRSPRTAASTRLLTRAPYVTDLTQTSADVTWATTDSARRRHPQVGDGVQLHGQHRGRPVDPARLVNGPSPPSATGATVHRRLDERVPVDGDRSPASSRAPPTATGSSRPADHRPARQQQLADLHHPGRRGCQLIGHLRRGRRPGRDQLLAAGPTSPDSLNTDQAAIDSLIGILGCPVRGHRRRRRPTAAAPRPTTATCSRRARRSATSSVPPTGRRPAGSRPSGASATTGRTWTACASGPSRTPPPPPAGAYAYDSYPGGVDGTARAALRTSGTPSPPGTCASTCWTPAWADGNVGTANHLPGRLRQALGPGLARVPVAGSRPGQPSGRRQDGRLPLPAPFGQLDPVQRRLPPEQLGQPERLDQPRGAARRQRRLHRLQRPRPHLPAHQPPACPGRSPTT